MNALTRADSSGGVHETYVSTVSHQAPSQPRLSCPHEHAGGPQGSFAPSAQGPQAARTHDLLEETLTRGGCPQSFPPSVRLKKRRQFDEVHRSGRRLSGRYTVVLYNQNDVCMPRFGLTVSRKVGNAVVRNRIKRTFREFARVRRGHWPAVDFVWIARPGAGRATREQLVDDLARALSKLPSERGHGSA